VAAVLAHAQVRQLLCRGHFSVHGTLIEARASMKSFRPKDGADQPPDGGRNGSWNFHGERRRWTGAHGGKAFFPYAPTTSAMSTMASSWTSRRHRDAPSRGDRGQA
jgi:hypothetical protein